MSYSTTERNAVERDLETDDTRPFPIQANFGPDRRAESTIPWWLAEIAYREYSKQYGTKQSLERLAERGGFGRKELMYLLTGKWIEL